MERLEVIQSLIDNRKFTAYLEIGVLGGYNFFRVKCDYKVAVDPHFQFNWKGRVGETLRNVDNLKAFYSETTSDNFFEMEAPRIFRKKDLDICLVDGMHEFDFALRDVMNSLDYLAENGVIVMHDCNPQSPESASSYKEWKARDSAGFWNGDVWKVIPYLRETRSDLEVFVADCDHGLGIITKSTRPKKHLPDPIEKFKALTYADLAANREALLNLKPVSWLEEFVASEIVSAKV